MNHKLQRAMETARRLNKAIFIYDGDFTICMLSIERIEGETEIIIRNSLGVAKRNPSADEYNRKRGEDIALARAIKKVLFPKESIKWVELNHG